MKHLSKKVDEFFTEAMDLQRTLGDESALQFLKHTSVLFEEQWNTPRTIRDIDMPSSSGFGGGKVTYEDNPFDRKAKEIARSLASDNNLNEEGRAASLSNIRSTLNAALLLTSINFKKSCPEFG